MTRTPLLRVVLAAAIVFALAVPLAGLHGDERTGFRFEWTPPLAAAGTAIVAGFLFLGADAAVRAGRASAPPAVPQWLRSAGPWAILAVVAALPLLGLPGAWTKLLLDTFVYATIAVGLQITIGMAGLLVLGHAGFWAIGAYTFVMLVIHLHWNFWLAWAAAGAAAAFAGLLVGVPALRLRGDYLAIVTLGFGEAIRWVIKNEQRWTGGDANLPGNVVQGDLRRPNGVLGEVLWQPGGVAGRDVDLECYWLALVVLAAAVVCVSLLARSRLGRALFALREDETAAKCMGIDVTRTKLLAFTASAMWAGLAGVVPAMQRGAINPELYDFNASVLLVAMVVLGGLGSVAGAVLGAALLWMAPILLADWFPDVQKFRYLAFGAVMVAMMIVKPDGLLGGFSGGRRKSSAA